MTEPTKCYGCIAGEPCSVHNPPPPPEPAPWECFTCGNTTSHRTENANLRVQRDYLQDLIHTAAATLDIVAASPQDFVTHVLLLREERDELKARLEAFTSILFEECQPNNGDLFSRVDDRIRALAKEPKP